MTARTASSPPAEPILPGALTVSLTEAARRLGVGLGTLRKAVEAGDVPAVRVGRRILVPVWALDQIGRPWAAQLQGRTRGLHPIGVLLAEAWRAEAHRP